MILKVPKSQVWMDESYASSYILSIKVSFIQVQEFIQDIINPMSF